jgi:hypothetical protein
VILEIYNSVRGKPIMKKSLVLAMAMALGVTASAYAAMSCGKTSSFIINLFILKGT